MPSVRTPRQVRNPVVRDHGKVYVRDLSFPTTKRGHPIDPRREDRSNTGEKQSNVRLAPKRGCGLVLDL